MGKMVPDLHILQRRFLHHLGDKDSTNNNFTFSHLSFRPSLIGPHSQNPLGIFTIPALAGFRRMYKKSTSPCPKGSYEAFLDVVIFAIDYCPVYQSRRDL